MISSTKSLTIALAFIAITAIGTSAIATTYADINTRSAFIQTDKGVQLKVIGVPGPKGDKGADGQNGQNGNDGTPGAAGAPGKDGTTLDNETLANVNSLSANAAVFQQIIQSYQNGSLNGKDGSNGVDGKDGTNGTVTFICYDANNQTMVCPFTQLPNDNQTIPPVVNNTGNGTGTGGNSTEPIVCGNGEINVNGTCQVALPPIDENGTVVIPPTNDTGTGGNDTTPIPEPLPTNDTGTVTNTTTTTNTTSSTNNDTTTSNSTSETVPTTFNLNSLAKQLGF